MGERAWTESTEASGSTPPLPMEVPEIEASGTVARLYDEIRAALRSPNVNLVYRLLVRYPDYLVAAWAQIGPNLASRYVEREAERLRALAAPDVGTAAAHFRHELLALGLTEDDLAEIRGIVDLFNYANPKNLICVSALRMALDDQPIPGTRDVEGGQPVPSEPLPRVDVKMPDPQSVTGEARVVLDEVLRAHQTGNALPSVYRALAHRPAFLRAAWDALRTFVERPELADRARHLVAEAERSALALPHPVDLSATETERLVGADGRAVIEEVMRRFQTAMIAPMTVEIHTLKALLDGQDAARSSPLAWRG